MFDLYKRQILDHYKNPRNFGTMDNPDVRVREANASCGDMVEVAMQFKKLKNKNEKLKIIVNDVKFKGIGCAISMASASLLTEEVKGKTVKDIKKMTENDVFKLLGGTVSPGRVKCALLPFMAIQKGVSEYEAKNQ